MIASADGCRGGWVVAGMDPSNGRETPWVERLADFDGVLRRTRGFRCVVVDMPLGLPADGCRRECDRLAKQALGRHHSRVFPAPPRSLLACPDYAAFNREHRRQFGGVGVSRQTFGLMAKLRETDAVLTPALQETVCEFHPELVWQRLAGAPVPSKHQPAGLDVRWRLLTKRFPGVVELRGRHRALGSGVQEDDLLDALVGLDLAWRWAADPHGAGVTCLPAPPERDGRGLRMEIWF